MSASRRRGTDISGNFVRGAFIASGHRVIGQRWLTNNLSDIRNLLREWIDSMRFDVIVALGGTGVDPTDVTPEAVMPLVTKAMPGFGEAFRELAFRELGIGALESRAFAAICQRTRVYILPGAPEGVTLAMNRLVVPQLRNVGIPALPPTVLLSTTQDTTRVYPWPLAANSG
jgi:molybdenum cofactor biosynthesis protein B